MAAPRHLRPVQTALLTHALVLGGVGGVAALLGALARPMWAAVWLGIGLLASEGLLYAMLRPACAPEINSLAEAIPDLLAGIEAQERALDAQGQQIEALTRALEAIRAIGRRAPNGD